MNVARAVLAFLALPGTVAFVVPALLLNDQSRRFDPFSLILLLPGVAGLLACVRSFYVEGRGTLAPWSPPEHLVVSGLYRYSRNPMYVSVALILWGWAAAFHSSTLSVYALAVVVAFHLRVVLGEEPWLARTHGEAWERYKASVPRWVTGRVAIRVSLTLVGAMVLVIAATFVRLGLYTSGEDYTRRVAFDSAAWKSRSLDNDPAWPTRLRMIDDLVRNERLDRLAREQVLALLGPPDDTDKWRDWDAVYWLGPNRGLIRIDSEWLVLRFDAAGRVVRYEVVED